MTGGRRPICEANRSEAIPVRETGPAKGGEHHLRIADAELAGRSVKAEPMARICRPTTLCLGTHSKKTGAVTVPTEKRNDAKRGPTSCPRRWCRSFHPAGAAAKKKRPAIR